MNAVVNLRSWGLILSDVIDLWLHRKCSVKRRSVEDKDRDKPRKMGKGAYAKDMFGKLS